GVQVVVVAAAHLRQDDTHKGDGNDEDDRGGRRPALVERGQHHVDQDDGKRVDEVRLVADLFLLVARRGPVVRHAFRQRLRGQLLHGVEGLAGAEARSGRPEDGRRRIEIVASDQLGALHLPDLDQGVQRDHLSVLVSNVEVPQVVGLQTIGVVGLDVDLEHLVELVEEVDERGAQVGLQRVEDALREDLQGFRFGPVDVQVYLGAARAEGRGEATQARTGVPLLDELGGVARELAQAEAPAVLHHHLEAAGLAGAADGRRNHHEGQRFLDPGEVAVETGDDPILGQPLAALAPVLVHDEGGGDVRDVGEVEDREPADGHPSGQPVRLLEERGDLLRDRARPGLSGALGQDGYQHRVALVLGGEEPGGLANESPGGRPDDEGKEHDHGHRVLHHPGDDAHVDPGHALERPVEPAIEPVRPLVAAGPQPRRALDWLQRERVQRADDRGRGDDERELAEDLSGDAGQEGGGQEDRDQRQGDTHHRAGELLHGPDGRFLGRHPLLDVVGAVLDDDDGVVYHDADGQDQGEQGHQVHGEAEPGHGDEGADDGDRHGGGGNQHAAEV